MASKRHLVELFYDVLSPYSYLSFKLMNRCSKQWNSIDLQLRPVLVGGIFKATGNQEPRQIPAKGKYMWKDLEQLSEYYKIPFKLPKDVERDFFSKGSVKAQRLLTFVEKEYPQRLFGISDEIYKRIWVDDLDISELGSLQEACISAGLTVQESSNVSTGLNQDDVKEGLKRTTSHAIECGAFGTPTYILHRNDKKDLFFGTDRIFLLAHYLNEPWPVFPKD